MILVNFIRIPQSLYPDADPDHNSVPKNANLAPKHCYLNWSNPGSMVKKIPDPVPHQRIRILALKIFSKLSEIWSGTLI